MGLRIRWAQHLLVKDLPMGSVDFSIPHSAVFGTDVKEEISK
jgi:hypothetical protein